MAEQSLPQYNDSNVLSDKEFKIAVLNILASFAERFEAMDRQFEAIDKRFDGVDKRFVAMNKLFDGVDKRFDGVDKRFEIIDKRFDGVDKQFKTIGRQFEGVNRRFDLQDRRIDGLGIRVTTQINELDHHLTELIKESDKRQTARINKLTTCSKAQQTFKRLAGRRSGSSRCRR